MITAAAKLTRKESRRTVTCSNPEDRAYGQNAALIRPFIAASTGTHLQSSQKDPVRGPRSKGPAEAAWLKGGSQRHWGGWGCPASPVGCLGLPGQEEAGKLPGQGLWQSEYPLLRVGGPGWVSA